MPRHCGSDSGWLRPADATGSRIAPTIGLHHVAFNIGTTMDELREAGIEVYVDASDAWRREPPRVAQAKPLEI
jgi:hypothetical protein